MAQDRTRVDIPSEYRIPLVMRPYEKSPSYEEAQAYTDKYGSELINPDNSGVNLPQTTEERNNEKIVNNLENLGDVAMNLWDATDLLHIPASVATTAAKNALLIPVSVAGRRASEKAQEIWTRKALAMSLGRMPTDRDMRIFYNLPEVQQDNLLKTIKPWSKKSTPYKDRLSVSDEDAVKAIKFDKEHNYGLYFDDTPNDIVDGREFHNLIRTDDKGVMQGTNPVEFKLNGGGDNFIMQDNVINSENNTPSMSWLLHEGNHADDYARGKLNRVTAEEDLYEPYDFVSLSDNNELGKMLDNNEFLNSIQFNSSGSYSRLKDGEANIHKTYDDKVNSIPISPRFRGEIGKKGVAGDWKQLQEAFRGNRYLTEADHPIIQNGDLMTPHNAVIELVPEMDSHFTEILGYKNGYEWLKKNFPRELDRYMDLKHVEPRTFLFPNEFDNGSELMRDFRKMYNAGLLK